jgi:hypothetical protein
VVAQSFIDAAHDFTKIAGWENSGKSRVLTNLHADALHKLYALRRLQTEAGLYDLSRRPYDGPVLRMQGTADDRRLEVCTQTDYLRAGVPFLHPRLAPGPHDHPGRREPGAADG